MNSKHRVWAVLYVVSLSIGCSSNQEPDDSPSKLLIGQWNSYEMGTNQTGFAPIITTSLTIGYESGMNFVKDGTFKLRKYNISNKTWSEDNVAIGVYQLKTDSILLTYFPGTMDELKLNLQLVKLDKYHLWFKHNYFGTEIEHHLKRPD